MPSLNPDQIQILTDYFGVQPSAHGKLCVDKVAFPTEKAALAALMNVAVRVARRGRDTYRRVYRCTVCGDWHLTGQQPRGSAGTLAYIRMLERTIVFLLRRIDEEECGIRRRSWAIAKADDDA